MDGRDGANKHTGSSIEREYLIELRRNKFHIYVRAGDTKEVLQSSSSS